MPKLIRLGKCNQCGKCCDPATVPERLAVYARAGLKALLQHSGKPCPHFHYQDGHGVCDIYPLRPYVCRVFPTIPEDIEALPGCGYAFIWTTTSVLPGASGGDRHAAGASTGWRGAPGAYFGILMVKEAT